MVDAHAPAKPVAGEVPGRQAGEFGIKGDDDGGVDTERFEQFQLLFRAGQGERRFFRQEELRRVRREGADEGRPALVPRPGDGSADHRLMAAMHAVESAKGDHSATKRCRQPAVRRRHDHGCPPATSARTWVSKRKAGAAPSAA